jgi:hypothetical protein
MPLTWAFVGGDEGTRTLNPLLAKQVRYQLRHVPAEKHHDCSVRNRINAKRHAILFDGIGDFRPKCLFGLTVLNPSPEGVTDSSSDRGNKYFPHGVSSVYNTYIHQIDDLSRLVRDDQLRLDNSRPHALHEYTPRSTYRSGLIVVPGL